jgi:hypothetical protein
MMSKNMNEQKKYNVGKDTSMRSCAITFIDSPTAQTYKYNRSLSSVGVYMAQAKTMAEREVCSATCSRYLRSVGLAK